MARAARTAGAGGAAIPGGDLETRLKTAGLVCGPAAAVLVCLVNPGNHPTEARRLLAVLVLSVVFWATEAIPLPATALLGSALAIVLGVAPARAVLQPYADPVIFLFVGSFLLAEAFKKYGLDRRVASWLLGTGRFARSSLGRFLGVGGASAVISTCLSNTATAALMTPIAIGAVRGRPGAAVATPRWVSGVLLMVAYGSSIGGMATLIGTPPNLLTAGFVERLCGVRVGFVSWLLFAAPIALVLFAASIACTHFALGRERVGEPAGELPAEPGETSEAAQDDLAEVAPESDPLRLRRGARLTTAAFALAALLWTLPSLVALALGPGSGLARTLEGHLPESSVALLCATLLFAAPVDWRRRRFALTWEEGRRVNWGIILLFGGGLSLGSLAVSTGVARWVGEGLGALGIARTDAGLLFCAVAMAIFVSEFASNTASATLLVPIVIAAAQAAGLDPVAPALGVGLGATCGFVFPVSTPPNAIVFGTGLVPMRRMIRAGILLDLVTLIVIWGGLLVLGPVLPR